jgi:hypothetical protein
MTGVIMALWPIAPLIVLAIVAIPLWMTFRHRAAAAPDYREALSRYRARRAAPGAGPASDPGPAGPSTAVDGLTIVRRTRAADDDDLAIPAQRHW